MAPKGLHDREPAAKDKLLSLADREARPGKHGAYYEGYLLEVSREADAELLGAVEVLPANGDEAANATQLLANEEQVHGTDIASLSLDRIGYRGDVWAELREAADGPPLTVYVPPIAWVPLVPGLFPPDRFTLHDAGDEVRCPGGATAGRRTRTQRDHGWQFRFRSAQCHACPVRAQCLPPDPRGGRSVLKNDYEAQSRAAQQRAQTPADQAVRREPPRIERKWAALSRWHAGRHVRYRGRRRVKIQYLLTAVVVNGKRIVKLLSLPLQPQLT